MQTFKLTILFFLVAATVLIVFGTIDLRSQARYAEKMNAPALISTIAPSTGTASHSHPGKTNKNSVAGQKAKNQDL